MTRVRFWTILCFSSCWPPSQVYDGKDTAAHLMGSYTGTAMLGLSLTSTSNQLWLEFYSDQEATGEGFKLQYYSKSSAGLELLHYGKKIIVTIILLNIKIAIIFELENMMRYVFLSKKTFVTENFEISC